MGLNKEIFNRSTNIKATVVCDSVSEDEQRVTTFVLEYPRFFHSELLTSRDLSKNSSSSRAIPLNKMLETMVENPAIPIHFGLNKSGMQASDDEADYQDACDAWLDGMYEAVEVSKKLGGKHELNIHKQIANRVTEPYQMIKVVMTATNFDNLFNLRIHSDAQPDFTVLTYKMHQALQQSKPKLLKKGQWHLPFVDTVEANVDIDSVAPNKDKQRYFLPDGQGEVYLDDALKYSIACCAAVSYRTEVMTMEKADKIYNMLVGADVVHSSPLEHICTPIVGNVYDNINKSFDPDTWEYGITHVRKNGKLCSGNFVGWIQYRHLLDNNTCYSYNHEERMKTFN